jgi:hypothetical protein
LLAPAPLRPKQRAFRLTASHGKNGRLDQRRAVALGQERTPMTIQFVTVIPILRIYAGSITREDQVAESKAARR